MNDIASVAIIYRNEDRHIYQCYTEFLRLVGIYVCEELINQDIDVNVNDYMQETGCSAYYEVTGNESKEHDTLYFLKSELDRQFKETEPWIPYEAVRKIFNENELLQASVTLQYFRTNARSNGMKGELRNVAKKFEKAADEFVALIEQDNTYIDNYYVRYARLYCKQKANLASSLSDGSVIYFINDLAAEGTALKDDFPTFSNAWVLLGFVYEISKTYTYEAIAAFSHAIEMEGDKKYISSIYYWLGKRYEELNSVKEKANSCFERAYQIMPKYRNAYKIAVAYMHKKVWDEAEKYFMECISYIKGREELWDPLEQEYYFKIKVHLGYIYLQKREYHKSINCSESAINLKESIEDSPEKFTKFYKKIYIRDEKVDEIVKLTLEKMTNRQVYAHLSKAYGELSMTERSVTYSKLLP